MKFKIRKLKWVLLAFAVNAFGADVTMTVSPPIISMEESAQIKVEVRNAKRPKTPAFPPVDGLKFSKIGKSSNTRIINNKMDSSVAYTATVYPQRTGDFAIGPFAYQVDGETKQLSAILKVVATSGDATAAQSWSDLVFARITSNRDKAYVQEPFELTLEIFSKPGLPIQGVENLRGLPETGLSKKTEWKGSAPVREHLDGVLYDIRRFKSSMRAVGSGVFTFAPTVTVQIAAPQQQQRRQRDPFGFDSFFNRTQTRPVALNVTPTEVEVLPLPTSGKPDGFNGAVGRFYFQVTAEPKEVSPGDPITLQMTIIGNGNYDRIQSPALPVDAPFRLFGDAVRQQGDNGVRFEQVISPQDATVTEIPPLSFSYFDSQTGAYRTLSSKVIPITVAASSNNTAQLFVAKDTVTIAPADTPFATESDVQRMAKWFRTQWKLIRPWLWTLPAALGAGLLLFFGQKFIHWRRKDTVWMRRQQAPKAARQALRIAHKALRQREVPEFYNALREALTGYFGNRLNLPPGDVTLDQMSTILTHANLPETHLETLTQLFRAVEQYRYGVPGEDPAPAEMESLITEWVRLMKAVEKISL